MICVHRQELPADQERRDHRVPAVAHQREQHQHERDVRPQGDVWRRRRICFISRSGRGQTLTPPAIAAGLPLFHGGTVRPRSSTAVARARRDCRRALTQGCLEHGRWRRPRYIGSRPRHALSDIARHAASSVRHTSTMPAAIASGSSCGTRIPPPRATSSGAAPAGVAITGVRHAIASSSGSPNPSAAAAEQPGVALPVQVLDPVLRRLENEFRSLPAAAGPRPAGSRRTTPAATPAPAPPPALNAARLTSQPLKCTVEYITPTVGIGCLPRGGTENCSRSTALGTSDTSSSPNRSPARSDQPLRHRDLVHRQPPGGVDPVGVAGKNLMVLNEVRLGSLGRRERRRPLGRLPPGGDDHVGIRHVRAPSRAGSCPAT